MYGLRQRFPVLTMACLLLCVHGPAWAQFAGDVFYREPSVAVNEGATGTVEMLTFVGATPLGALRVRITFDPTALAVVSVTGGDTLELQAGLQSRQAPSGLDVLIVNGRSLSTPFGTASLARLQLKPLTPAGSVVPFHTEVLEVLDTAVRPFPHTAGFGGEIVVTAPRAALRSARHEAVPLAVMTLEPSIRQRAYALARPGATVPLMLLDAFQQATATAILLLDTTHPAQPPETAEP